jgi:4-diphosphocytidyl-2-C-methyl-D-erythritol kinase
VNRAPAPAKINLALLVGPLRDDGKHEVATILQRVDLCDRVRVERGRRLRVRGFAEDALVTGALEELARAAGVTPRFDVWIEKHVPVAAGLGGGSSDAATALRLANDLLDQPLAAGALHALAARIGADVPFFLGHGPQLGRGDGTTLEPVELPQDFHVVLLLPDGAQKRSTRAVYEAFDARAGARGFDERVRALERTLPEVRRARDLALLPPNDLASSPLAAELLAVGAFRADVSGAGPALYGLFLHERDAVAAARKLRVHGRTWRTIPAWYG